jgi:hypothetical protein
VEVVEALDVGVVTRALTVGDEDDAVHPAQDELARGVVVHLSGHRVEVKAGLETLHGAQLEGQEVEEEGAVHLRGQRDELALGGGIDLVVDVLDVSRLAAKTGAVVDDFAVDFAGRIVDERHAPTPASTPSLR